MHRFADELGVVLWIQLVGDDAAAAIHETQFAAVMFPSAVRIHQPHEQRREIAEDLDLAAVCLERDLEEVKRRLHRRVSLGQPPQNAFAILRVQRTANPAGHGPSRMDFLAAEKLDDLLAELPQADAGAGQFLVLADKAEDIALRLRGVPAQQEIRRTEMKETQGVALDKLAQVHQPAEFVRRRRDADGHDGVAGLGGRQQMAHRTDAADPRRDAGHFIVGTALAEFFKAAKLHDMELGVGDVAFIV